MMNFKITLEIDNNAEKKAKDIIDLSEQLHSHFLSKNYGSDVKEVLIGAIIIKTRPGYEDWFKIRKPKYIDYKKTKNKLTGIEMIVDKSFSFDIKIDDAIYDDFILSDVMEGKKIISSTIINSLSNLDYLKKKVKDFDIDKFKKDIIFFLEEYTD
ncbi:hypothetical protein [Flavobacterium sp. 316]|uniref:hypothetical protein n=1 Tax=Flavobacterium sp. 316 TaxID=1603293 RepID=UPI000AB777F0|nr:hypothetical protein [Flavobacterium sp. 316]